jgi:hypothetical protein
MKKRPSTKRKLEDLKAGKTTPVDASILAFIEEPGVDERAVLILASVYNDVGPQRVAVPWDLQVKASDFYNRRGLEATLKEIVSLGGSKYLEGYLR